MPIPIYVTIDAEVREQMSRFGSLSEERSSVFKTSSKLGTHLSTQCSGDERQSRPCKAHCPDTQVCRFGVPGKIITDQGRQFESQLFRSLAAICGAKVAHATSYHPECNGKVERLHRTLKGAIKAHNNIKWTDTLPTILLGLRTALRPDTNLTIAQMVYGSNIRLPGEFFNPPSIQIDFETFVTTLQTFMDELKPTKSSPPKSQKIFVHKDLKSCTHVFVRVDRVRKALEPHMMVHSQ
ncbi:retrovirus-related Pol polyprotein from transposon opus [Trichonephila clavipes]|nr:retrovirus-related Pol polyprotein from transposon opus [Trichonephila clavipes]